MPYLPSWDEAKPADILSHPLKGEYVIRLATALQVMLDNAALMHGGVSHEETEPTYRMIKGVLNEIKRRLDHDGVSSFGLDFKDFKTIISTVCASPEFDYERAITDMKNRLDGPEEFVKYEIADAAESSMGSYIMGFFSACLALQENRLDEYKQLMTDFARQQAQLMAQNVVDVKSQEENIPSVTAALFGLEVMMLKELEMARKADALLARLYEMAVLGDDGVIETIRNNVAMLHDIDRETHQGRENMRSMEKESLTRICDTLGIPPITLPDDHGAGQSR